MVILKKTQYNTVLQRNVTQRVLKQVRGDVTIGITYGLTPTSILGSAYSGAEGSGRTYVHTETISANAVLFLGTTDGGLLLVHPSKWTKSTTTVTNDTITLNVYLQNTDATVLFS